MKWLVLALFLQPKEFDERRAALKSVREPGPWCELGEWAVERAMKDRARTCFLEALKFDGENTRAHEGMRKLGFEKVDSRWVRLDAIFSKKRAGLKPDDADGLFELALWCKARQMIREWRLALDGVLKIQPDHRKAREELGQKNFHGEWLDPAGYEREMRVDEVWRRCLAENRPPTEELKKAGLSWSGDAAVVLERAKNPGPGTYRDVKLEGSTGEYTYGIPRDYVPWRKSPMIVFLHGGGMGVGDGDEYFGDVWSVGAPRGCIVVCPTVLSKISGGWSNERNTEYIRQLVRALQKKYSADPDRTYLWGHSMGGAGVFFIGTRTTEIFAAISPMTGDLYGWIPENLRKTPIRIVHGEKDPSPGVDKSRRAAQWLRERGFAHVYDEIPGEGHDVPGEYWNKVADWFLNHRLSR
jgi:predicted esterase